MRYKLLLILSAAFLVAVYTIFLWIDTISFFLQLLVAISLSLGFLCLAICLLWHLFFCIKEKFKDKQRNSILGVLCCVMLVAYFQPFGLLTIDRFQGKDLLVAQHEGSANCMTVLKLKEGNQFLEQSVCFGIERVSGRYELRNDTIYFMDVELNKGIISYYKFAVIQKEKDGESELGTLTRYKDYNNSTAKPLWIIKNDLN